MLKSIQRLGDFISNIRVPWSKLISEEVENGKVDLVCSVRVSGMDLGLDVGRIVFENIENIVTLILVCTNNFGINRDVISNQRVRYNSFLKSKVFGRVASINRRDLSLEFLSDTPSAET